MSGATLYAMSEKGFAVVRRFIGAWPGLLRSVVTSRDAGVERDYADEILEACRKNGIPCQERAQANSVPHAATIIAVSWRWLIEGLSSTVVVMHDSLLPRYRGCS